jgi:hypothetical protein
LHAAFNTYAAFLLIKKAQQIAITGTALPVMSFASGSLKDQCSMKPAVINKGKMHAILASERVVPPAIPNVGTPAPPVYWPALPDPTDVAVTEQIGSRPPAAPLPALPEFTDINNALPGRRAL